jgi:mannan endo-1,4-beta-mannosidase
MLRSHAFKMAGLPVPPHPVPPAPIITTKSLGIVRWRGSAGAVNYSVERSMPDGNWELICDKCAKDSDMGWPDLSFKGLMGAKYRSTAYNADGEPGPPSAAR